MTLFCHDIDYNYETDPLSSSFYGSAYPYLPPMAIKYKPCRYPGEYIRIFDKFLLSQNFGLSKNHPDRIKLQKLFVKEWAKYRWGVFDETPIPNRETYREK